MKTAIAIIVLSISLFNVTISLAMWPSQLNSMLKTRATKELSTFSPSPDLMKSIGNGVTIAIEQCKEVFIYDRWNCPDSAFSRRYRHPFSKEAAYTQAITAAGIVYSITKSCSRGEIIGCGCDPLRSNTSLIQFEINKNLETKVDWTWDRCSDDTTFGERISKHILNSLETGNDAQAYSTLHNHNVGRNIVQKTMQKQCRCHGMSGSCSVQTCWLQLANFAEIAQTLKQLYRKAIKINFEHAPYGFTMGNSARVSVEGILRKHFDSLVYLEDSPDYCKANALIGWPGTKGRPCSKFNTDKTDIAERKSCRNICRACGYKVRKQRQEVTRRCNCVFTYCCEVKCDNCTEIVETFYCG